MFDTVIAMETPGPVQLRAKWLQLCDLLGQRGDVMPPQSAIIALRNLASLKPKIDIETRIQAARAVGNRARFAPLVVFFAHDVSAVAREMLIRAHLADADWIAMLPTLSPVSRNLLRTRSDLSPDLRRALNSFGASDFALPSADDMAKPDAAISRSNADAVFTPTPTPDGSIVDATYDQIHDLVQRIETFRAKRAAQHAQDTGAFGGIGNIGAGAGQRIPHVQFTFDVGEDGLIRDVEGVRRGTIIGLSIAEAAYGEEPGTDAYSAGAFRQRSEIVNARLRLEGDPHIRGDWRFSAIPRFNSATGQFLGYSGRARRPKIGESAQLLHASAQKSAGASRDDGLRQLLHELKTPLNAISGFSQIIEEQIFGPVGSRYRSMASAIRSDAEYVQSVFDDLDRLSRNAEDAAKHVTSSPDARNMLLQITNILQPSTEARGVDLVIGISDDVMPLDMDDRTAQRMFMRLISGLIDTAETGETLRANLTPSLSLPQQIEFGISLPARLQGMTRADLLDTETSADRAPRDTAQLALGFSLRLIQSLAAESHGELQFAPERLVLKLPMARALAEISDVQG